MNEMNPKRLSLNRETIRNLSDENLEQVAGGQRRGDDRDRGYSRRDYRGCNRPSQRRYGDRCRD
ncbi:class I lanthipeptide [Cystobacter fuscus]|uniref:class I lanthipeptide n=1 Tax=Cystobacter fuscus TaxID=43 RepID=UPI0012DD16C3|nr:class I lanthipeptide [Cystobacter fuscus]